MISFSTCTLGILSSVRAVADDRAVFIITSSSGPVIGPIANRTISEDGFAVVNFTVSDSDTDLNALILGASSANTVLVPNANITLDGTGSNRTATITPAANRSGNASIFITASDGSSTVTNSFLLTVTSVNDAPTLNVLSDLEIPRDASQQTINLSGISAGSLETQPLRITASSSNTGLIPDPSVTYTSPQSTGSIRFTPVAGNYGATLITVTVEDGGPDSNLNTVGDNATFSRTFTVTVTPGTNADLSGLSLSSGALNPSFSESITNYSATVSNSVSSITVTPTLADAYAFVTVNDAPVDSGVASGLIPLSVGTNIITVVVTAQDGIATMIYRVSVARQPPPLPVNPSMNALVMTGGQVNISINAVTGLYYYLVYPAVPLAQISIDPINLAQWGVADSEAPATNSPVSLQDPDASTQTGRVYGVLIRSEAIPP